LAPFLHFRKTLAEANDPNSVSAVRNELSNGLVAGVVEAA
jgi:hypothetical protein